MYVILHN